MARNKVLVGADPEIFVKKNGEYISAHGLVPGDKENPHPVPFGAVQVDGMALEFNIDPAKNKTEFVRNLTNVMGTLREMVEVEDGIEVESVATAHFSDEVFEASPAEALILGCEPDFNAHTGQENVPPNPDVKFRTAAGHLHLGWTEGVDIDDPNHFEACRLLARELDVIAAMQFIQYDEDMERRQLYGKFGSFRPKSYGMEYRALSNRWLDHPKLMKWAFDSCQKAWDNLMKKRTAQHFARHCLSSSIINWDDKDILRDEWWKARNIQLGSEMFVELPDVPGVNRV